MAFWNGHSEEARSEICKSEFSEINFLNQSGIVQVAVLEKEKAMLASAEKRASEEVASLSERVHRLQVDILLIFRRQIWMFSCAVCAKARPCLNSVDIPTASEDALL